MGGLPNPSGLTVPCNEPVDHGIGRPMTQNNLLFTTLRERYQSQRDRREMIRNSVATPVSALAFSVYTLGWVSGRVDLDYLHTPAHMAVIALMILSVLCLLAGAFLIIRMEKNIVYIDPPDLQELVWAEEKLREDNQDEAYIEKQLERMLTASYDIIYRRYFASNEQASRDRTRGLHSIIVGLCLIMIAMLITPFDGVPA